MRRVWTGYRDAKEADFEDAYAEAYKEYLEEGYDEDTAHGMAVDRATEVVTWVNEAAVRY
jgi:hypothetical protein